jgi:hypothetical protein
MANMSLVDWPVNMDIIDMKGAVMSDGSRGFDVSCPSVVGNILQHRPGACVPTTTQTQQESM